MSKTQKKTKRKVVKSKRTYTKNDPSWFAKEFKKTFGVSVEQWMKHRAALREQK